MKLAKRDLEDYMRDALALAGKAKGKTSPNPMVGAVLVNRGRIIGKGWHKRAGKPHAEIEAILQARRSGSPTAGATLFVTLEPCCTFGRTPPCTEAILQARIKNVVVGAVDPNPNHAGKGLLLLENAGVRIFRGILEKEAEALNENFNFWIAQQRPFVTIKSALSLDGKIATSSGDSKWITGAAARRFSMELRDAHDAILVGVNTIIADDPSLTIRLKGEEKCKRRLILDPAARIPLKANVLTDKFVDQTTVFVSAKAEQSKVKLLEKRVQVEKLSNHKGEFKLAELSLRLGQQNCVSLLVEGGGETTARFLEQGLVQRAYFFYGPKIIGGRSSQRAVAGTGFTRLEQFPVLKNAQWKTLGSDLMLTGRI